MTAKCRLNTLMKKSTDESHRYSNCAQHVYAEAVSQFRKPILKQVLRTQSVDIRIPSPATLFLDMFPPSSSLHIQFPKGNGEATHSGKKKKYKRLNNDDGEGRRKKKMQWKSHS